MGENIKLTAEDGFELDAYLAKPNGTPKGGVIVVQEIFGVNQHIREDTDRFAEHGYVALAPAMFDRAEKEVELRYDPKGIEKGRGLMGKLDWDDVMKDIHAAAKELKQYGKVGLVGYCWGGSVAWLAAARDTGIDCASGYYGGRVAHMLDEKPKVPVELHFGDKDAGIPVSDVEKIKAAYPDLPVYRYDEGEHGFHCDHRPSYNAEADKQSTARTLEFFKKHIG